jgi:hypothetical protein
MVDEKADLATPEEAAEFRAEVERKWKAGHGSLPWLTEKPAREPARRQEWRPHIDGRGSVTEVESTTPNAPGEKS